MIDGKARLGLNFASSGVPQSMHRKDVPLQPAISTEGALPLSSHAHAHAHAHPQPSARSPCAVACNRTRCVWQGPPLTWRVSCVVYLPGGCGERGVARAAAEGSRTEGAGRSAATNRSRRDIKQVTDSIQTHFTPHIACVVVKAHRTRHGTTRHARFSFPFSFAAFHFTPRNR